MTNNFSSTEETKNLTMDDLVARNFKPAKGSRQSKRGGRASELSITNTPKNGKRLSFSLDADNHLGNPRTIDFSYDAKGIMLGTNLKDEDNTYAPSRNESKPIIYSSSLVIELTEVFNLDFSNKTTISFYRSEYLMIDGVAAVFIPIRSTEKELDSNDENEETTD